MSHTPPVEIADLVEDLRSELKMAVQGRDFSAVATLLDEADRVEADCNMAIALGEELSAAVNMQSHEGLLRDSLIASHAKSERAFGSGIGAGAAALDADHAHADPDDDLPDMSGLKMHEKVRIRAAHRRAMKQRKLKQEQEGEA